jgi:hypothetical protein
MKLFIVIIVLTVLSSCNQEVKPIDKSGYTKKGKIIAQATFKKMGGEVVKNMKKGGVETAVLFCNKEASKLTAEMEQKYEVSIRRTSLKLRNTDNAPTDEEKAIIKKYNELKAHGEELKPIVESGKTEQIHFYAPIKIKKKCLSCHGQIGVSMEQKSDSIIKILYPSDKAIGYKEGDLRGIWSITFKSKK